jgi:hypothetical protein
VRPAVPRRSLNASLGGEAENFIADFRWPARNPGTRRKAGSGGGLGVRSSGIVVVVRCLRCRHEVTLSDQALARFGLKPRCI